MVDVPSSPASTVSSSTTSDSSSLSEPHEEAPADIAVEDEQDDEADSLLPEEDLVMMRTVPSTSPRSSASPVEALEERVAGEDCPLSARVYSNPDCKISAALHQQCSSLWAQFDSIGTEMIVTRRGR